MKNSQFGNEDALAQPPGSGKGVKPPRILVVEDERGQQLLYRSWLEAQGYTVDFFTLGEAALQSLDHVVADVVCLDQNLPGLSGLETLACMKKRDSTLPVLMLTADEQVEHVVEAMKLGAYDYLAKPIDQLRLLTAIRNAVEMRRASQRLLELEAQTSPGEYASMIGRCELMRRLFGRIERVANSHVTVLIRGESGTGKELVAQAVHQASLRKDGPFVALNCAALPEALQESELFGHERGAFTGAESRRTGRIEEADGGTLFLDEVAEMSPSLQAKLLRVLQERTFRRLGGNRELASDFRVVAATHRSLEERVQAGAFRQDLFYRLAVVELEVPPLRERREDIAALVLRFLPPEKGISIETLSVFERYRWPGNVRELQNAVESASVLSAGEMIRPEDLPRRLMEYGPSSDGPGQEFAPSRGRQAQETVVEEARAFVGNNSLQALEREAILGALEACEGNLAEAGRRLGIGRSTLYRRLKTYGLR